MSFFGINTPPIHPRTLALQSASASVSASASASALPSVTSSVASGSGASTSSYAGSVVDSEEASSEFSKKELLLIDQLQIPIELTRQSQDHTLISVYKRYKTGLQALNDASSMKKKPTAQEITDIFIKKSQWHNWKVAFTQVKQYPDMLNWLNEANTTLSAQDIWKCNQSSFTFNNLKAWLKNGGTMITEADESGKKKKKDKKGKEKA